MYTKERLDREIEARMEDQACMESKLMSDDAFGKVFKDPELAVSTINSVMHGTTFECVENLRHISDKAEGMGLVTSAEQAQAMNNDHASAEVAHFVLDKMKSDILEGNPSIEPDSAEHKVALVTTLLKDSDSRLAFGEMRGADGFVSDSERKNAVNTLKGLGEEGDEITPLLVRSAEAQLCIDDLEQRAEQAPSSQDLADGENTPSIEMDR